MNIYVGNLNYALQEEELKNIFEEMGNVVSAKIIKDRETGRSKGFGFVEFDSEESAQQAIDEMDGVEVMGRRLKVNKARQSARR